MLIYEALKNDHDKLKGLLERLVASADASQETRTDLINQVRDELVPHSRAEEAVFYNSLRSIDGVKGMIVHGYAEHMEAEGMLRTLQGVNATGADWTVIAKKLQDALLHHIEEEENEIFSAARQVLAEDEERMMAEAFLEMKPVVREGTFLQNTVDMIANMMPQRFAAPLRSFAHKV